MEYLLNDYSVFGDKEILSSVANISDETIDGYYEGKYTKELNMIVNQLCNSNDINTFILTTGTQTNTLVLSSLLKPYEAIISATTAHINTLEAGSIENLGHKILSFPSDDGKLKVSDIEKCLATNNDKHRVRPKVVYISQPTEVGTMYSENELTSLRKICDENNLLLYLDGARLSVALVKDENLTLEKYSNLTDIFYFGGTKNGIPLGEMVITKNNEFAKDFKFFMKQNGSLLAKGEFVSFLFLKLLENNKYKNLANKSLTQANKLIEFLKNQNANFKYSPQTNQLFITLNKDEVEKLSETFKFTIWEKCDNNKIVIRLVTSFSTKDSTIENFKTAFNNL